MQRVYTIGVAIDAKDVPKSVHAEELRAPGDFQDEGFDV
jgi:hypothetical protein